MKNTKYLSKTQNTLTSSDSQHIKSPVQFELIDFTLSELFIKTNSEIKSIIDHNPTIRVEELMRINFRDDFQYIGLVKISKLYIVLFKQQIICSTFSIHKATKELITCFSNYVDLLNWNTLKGSIIV